MIFSSEEKRLRKLWYEFTRTACMNSNILFPPFLLCLRYIIAI